MMMTELTAEDRIGFGNLGGLMLFVRISAVSDRYAANSYTGVSIIRFGFFSSHTIP